MGVIKTIERKGKRFLVRAASRLVKTPPLTVEEVLAVRPRRVLVVRQQNQMGDMLLATPAYRAIKESLGAPEVGVVSARINRDVLLNHPYVDRVFTYHNRDPLGAARMIRDIRREKYDLAIVLHTVSFSFTSALIGLLSGARVRVGSTSDPFGHGLGGAFYHLELPLPSKEELSKMNEAEHNLYPLRALRIDTADLSPVMAVSDENARFARDFVERTAKTGRKRIVVHPGAGKTENVWPPERFAEVANRLGERVEADFCVVKGPRDERHVEEFKRAAKVPFTILEGRPIGDVAAVLRGADLVLCNDTGIMHVACAVGANTLAVFGPTDPSRWAPRCPNLTVIRAQNGDFSRLDPGAVVERAMDAIAIPRRAG